MAGMNVFILVLVVVGLLLCGGDDDSFPFSLYGG